MYQRDEFCWEVNIEGQEFVRKWKIEDRYNHMEILF